MLKYDSQDVYIIQTAARNVNDIIMELLIMAYACRTSNCRSIIGVLPCLPYSQQTKERQSLPTKKLRKLAICYFPINSSSRFIDEK